MILFPSRNGHSVAFIMSEQPVDSCTKFRKAKLGTLWINKDGIQARLRRMTNPQTLKGVLYLLTTDKGTYIYETNPTNWKQVK